MMPKRLYFIASFYFLLLSFAVSVFVYTYIKQEKPSNVLGYTSKDRIIVTTTLKSNQVYLESAPIQKITAIDSRDKNFSITSEDCDTIQNTEGAITQGSTESRVITNCERAKSLKLSVKTNSGALSCSIYNDSHYNQSTPNSLTNNSNTIEGLKFQSNTSQIASPLKAPTLGNYLFLASK